MMQNSSNYLSMLESTINQDQNHPHDQIDSNATKAQWIARMQVTETLTEDVQ